MQDFVFVLRSFPHCASDLHMGTSEGNDASVSLWEDVNAAIHIRLHQPAGVGRCRVHTSEAGRVKDGKTIAADLRRICARVNWLWGWWGRVGGYGGGISRWFEYLLPLSGVVRCSPGATLSLPVFVVLAVFFFLLRSLSLTPVPRWYFLMITSSASFFASWTPCFAVPFIASFTWNPAVPFIFFHLFSTISITLGKKNEQKKNLPSFNFYPANKRAAASLANTSRALILTGTMVEFMLQESRNVFVRRTWGVLK